MTRRRKFVIHESVCVLARVYPIVVHVDSLGEKIYGRLKVFQADSTCDSACVSGLIPEKEKGVVIERFLG